MRDFLLACVAPLLALTGAQFVWVLVLFYLGVALGWAAHVCDRVAHEQRAAVDALEKFNPIGQ